MWKWSSQLWSNLEDVLEYYRILQLKLDMQEQPIRIWRNFSLDNRSTPQINTDIGLLIS